MPLSVWVWQQLHCETKHAVVISLQLQTFLIYRWPLSTRFGCSREKEATSWISYAVQGKEQQSVTRSTRSIGSTLWRMTIAKLLERKSRKRRWPMGIIVCKPNAWWNVILTSGKGSFESEMKLQSSWKKVTRNFYVILSTLTFRLTGLSVRVTC